MIDSMVKAVLQDATIGGILDAINGKYGNKTALRIKNEDGSLREISFVKLGRRVVSISSALINLGVNKGDRVAIISENRPEWVAAYFGIIYAGGAILPVDVKLSDAEIRFILNDSQARCVFVSARYLDTVDRLRPSLPGVENVILFDRSDRPGVIQLGKLRPHRGSQRQRRIYPEDTAIIVYTSGTTGTAKGVEISYKNLLFQVLEFSQVIRCTPGERLLSVLPLNHMLEITGGLIAPLYAGSCVTYCDTLKTSALLPLFGAPTSTSCPMPSGATDGILLLAPLVFFCASSVAALMRRLRSACIFSVPLFLGRALSISLSAVSFSLGVRASLNRFSAAK